MLKNWTKFTFKSVITEKEGYMKLKEILHSKSVAIINIDVYFQTVKVH